MATRLFVSPNTVRSQMAAIDRKLGTASRRGAIAAAVAAGLLTGAAVPA